MYVVDRCLEQACWLGTMCIGEYSEGLGRRSAQCSNNR